MKKYLRIIIVFMYIFSQMKKDTMVLANIQKVDGVKTVKAIKIRNECGKLYSKLDGRIYHMKLLCQI